MSDKIYVVVLTQGLYGDQEMDVYTYCKYESVAKDCVQELRRTIARFGRLWEDAEANKAFFNSEHKLPWPFSRMSEDVGSWDAHYVEVTAWSGDKVYL